MQKLQLLEKRQKEETLSNLKGTQGNIKQVGIRHVQTIEEQSTLEKEGTEDLEIFTTNSKGGIIGGVKGH